MKKAPWVNYRPEIKILDCSIRDGGLINNHVFDDEIVKVVVYGSFAREEATEDSDIDIAIIVRDDVDAYKVENSVNDLLFDLLLDRHELISVITIPNTLFNEYRSPLFLNIKREGIIL